MWQFIRAKWKFLRYALVIFQNQPFIILTYSSITCERDDRLTEAARGCSVDSDSDIVDREFLEVWYGVAGGGEATTGTTGSRPTDRSPDHL